MFRRKTRNSTAYTGVGQANNAVQQPNTNAMAAALSIGENLRETQPAKYGKSRTLSLKNQAHTTRSAGSLLKRSPSVQDGGFRPPVTRTSRAGSNASKRNTSMLSTGSTGKRLVYSVDDSFNDSLLEEMGKEADVHYSNRAKMEDVKLKHRPAEKPPVKMVKKYIPTPNGIKVVEVPESSMQQEIARSNSMRSGMSIKRSPLMQKTPRSASINSTSRQPTHKVTRSTGSRLSSLVSPPRIEEKVAEETREGAIDSATERQHEMDQLQKLIESEKRLAEELERKRLEYERLKQLRLENEKKMQELKKLEEEEEEAVSRSMSPVAEQIPKEHPIPKLATDIPESLEKGSDTTVENNAVENNAKSIEVQHNDNDIKKTLHEENNVQKLEGEDEEEEEEEEEEEDVPIKPLPIIVDELEVKKNEGDTLKPIDDHQDGHSSLYSLDASNTEIAATSSLSEGSDLDKVLEKVLKLNNKEGGEDEFGIEEVEDTDSPNLAHHLRPVFDPVTDDVPAISPTFDPVPEIIEEGYTDLNLTSHSPPNVASSLQSITSNESRSKPIKSAMKQPKATYSKSPKSENESPAHEAYLSLTTAENTRLNSKLSNSQLGDASDLPPEHHVNPPRSPNTVQKRVSQTLRKQPSGAMPGGMAGRSLRPASQADFHQPRTLAASNGGMSARSFKTQPQPIAPHPALQPNYQSPSKLKAADLYAKANSRPRSVFQPVQRKSSFSKNADQQAKPEAARPVSHIQHRTTLRAPAYSSPSARPSYEQLFTGNSSTAQESNGGSRFKSRLADSDDEDAGLSHFKGGEGFLSRFSDSADDLTKHSNVSGQKSSNDLAQAPVTSLRKNENEAPKEGKHKKKRFLKKLFGRN